MTDHSGGPANAPEQSHSKTWVVVAIIAVVAIAALLAAWWWMSGRNADPAASPSPSATPSPSLTARSTPTPPPSPSTSPSPTPTATTTTLADISGRWCSQTAPQECLTFDLPTVVWDADQDSPSFLFPPGADVADDPAGYDFGVPYNTGGCWQAVIDYWPGTSGTPIVFCPAHADRAGDFAGMPGPVDQDRLFLAFERPEDLPYLRAD